MREQIKKWIDRLAYGSVIGDLGLSALGWVPGFTQYSTLLIKATTIPTIPLGIAYFYMSRHAIAERARGHAKKGRDLLRYFFAFGG